MTGGRGDSPAVGSQEWAEGAAATLTEPLDLPEGTPRPLAMLSAYARRYPRAREQAEFIRAGKGSVTLGRWPEWCYLPLVGAMAIVANEHGEWVRAAARTLDAAVLGALLPWRMTKGIYRFDPDVFQSLWHTPVTGDLPAGVLCRLPEWCCYVELPPPFPASAFTLPEQFGGLKGFFVHLQWDPTKKRAELHLLLDRESGLVPLMLSLDTPTIRESYRTIQKGSLLAAGVREEDAEARLSGEDAHSNRETMAGLLAPFVSVALYLCSAEPEIVAAGEAGDDRRPGNPEPRRTKKHGQKLFAAKEVREWDVAWRIGAALRRASEAAEGDASGGSSGGGARKRPHIRRGHWHAFWRGPRDPARADEREKTVRWIPPLAVNAGLGEDLPAVVRRVR